MSLLDQLLSYFGVGIERRPPPRPDITAVEIPVQISRIFEADCERATINHEIAKRGGPRIQTTHIGLHGDSRSWFRTLTDWLQ